MDNNFNNIGLNFEYNEVNNNDIEKLSLEIALIDSVMAEDKDVAVSVLEKINGNKKISIKKVVVGNLNTNCYIVSNDFEALIIDPGDNFSNIKEVVDKEVVGVMLTHRHFDHIGALYDCLNYYNVPLYSFNNLKEGINKIGSIQFEVFYNPGHTVDSISYIFDDKMLSGDFIFKGTIGRCDVGGNINYMKNSIKKILDRKINYTIYPGHGNSTTLDDEREILKYYLN